MRLRFRISETPLVLTQTLFSNPDSTEKSQSLSDIQSSVRDAILEGAQPVLVPGDDRMSLVSYNKDHKRHRSSSNSSISDSLINPAKQFCIDIEQSELDYSLPNSAEEDDYEVQCSIAPITINSPLSSVDEELHRLFGENSPEVSLAGIPTSPTQKPETTCTTSNLEDIFNSSSETIPFNDRTDQYLKTIQQAKSRTSYPEASEPFPTTVEKPHIFDLPFPPGMNRPNSDDPHSTRSLHNPPSHLTDTPLNDIDLTIDKSPTNQNKSPSIDQKEEQIKVIINNR